MLVLFAAFAWAAASVLILPPGEDPEVWRSPAALAGLDLGAGGGGRSVAVQRVPGGWLLLADDGQGHERHVRIATPTDPQAREDAAWLAASLLRGFPVSGADPGSPVALAVPAPGEEVPAVRAAPTTAGDPLPASPPPRPASAPPPPAPPAPSPPAPSPTPSRPPPTPSPPLPPAPPRPPSASVARNPGPSAAPVPPSPPPPGPSPPPPAPPPGAATVPPGPSTTPRPTLPLRVVIGPALAWHPELGAGGGLEAGVERGVGAWGVGGTVRAVAPRRVPDVPGPSGAYVADALVTAGWTPDGPVRPALLALGGASLRSFDQGGETRASFAVPVLGAAAGVRVRLGESVKLGATARFEADLGETTVRIGERSAGALAVWQLGGGVTLIVAPQ